MMRKLFVALLVLAVVAGCGKGKDSFVLGQKFAQSNQLDKAVEHYRAAAKLDPENKEYALALAQAEAAYGKMIAADVDKILSEGELDFARIKRAADRADEGERLISGNPDIEAAEKKAADALERLGAETAEMIKKADGQFTQNAWLDGVMTLRAALARNPGYSGLSSMTSSKENSALAFYLAQAAQFERQENWVKVFEALEPASKIFPDNPDVKAKLEEAKTKNSDEYYLARADWYAALKEWDMAIRMAQYAVLINSTVDVLKKFAAMKHEAAAYHIAQAKDDVFNGRLHDAQGNIVKALSYDDNLKKDPDAAGTVQQVLELVYGKAKTFEQEGNYGNAQIWYGMVAAMDDRFADAFAKRQEMADKLKTRVTKKIAVIDFAPPSTNADAGKLVTNSLLTYITDKNRADVKILARDVMQAILREIEMSQSGLYDVETVKRVGRLKGADVFIQGSVLQYAVDKSESEGVKKDYVVVAEEDAINPAYELWLKSPAATDDNASASAPPQFIKKPIRQNVEYKVGNVKMQAFVSVAYKVIDVERGEIIVSNTLKNKKVFEDNFSEGVAYAGIEFDPLELPTESELLEESTEELISELGGDVLSRFHDLQIAYFTEGEDLEGKRQYVKAIEKYQDAVSLEAVNGVKTEITDKALAHIAELVKKVR